MHFARYPEIDAKCADSVGKLGLFSDRITISLGGFIGNVKK